MFDSSWSNLVRLWANLCRRWAESRLWSSCATIVGKLCGNFLGECGVRKLCSFCHSRLVQGCRHHNVRRPAWPRSARNCALRACHRLRVETGMVAEDSDVDARSPFGRRSRLLPGSDQVRTALDTGPNAAIFVRSWPRIGQLWLDFADFDQLWTVFGQFLEQAF